MQLPQGANRIMAGLGSEENPADICQAYISNSALKPNNGEK